MSVGASESTPRRRHGAVAATDRPGAGAGTYVASLAAVAACFVLSGFAALLYQTAWLRQFSLVFGTSELAVAAVLAAYMGGLAAGAALAGHVAARIRRPVLAYGVLEAGIAGSALAVPLLTALAGAAYAWMLGGLPEPPDSASIGQPLFYLSVAFVVLAVPTGLMGATLPLLTRYAVRVNSDIGPRVALLYSLNTLGAVAGTLVAAFALLPALGLSGTVWIGVASNVLVFTIAAGLARRLPAMPGDISSQARKDESRPPRFLASCVLPLLVSISSGAARNSASVRSAFREQPAWILPLMLLSGANAFLYEVLWTRMLSHVIGGSVYAFATMLAAFLAGIAIGSGLSGRAAVSRERAAGAFAVTQVAIAVLSVGVYAWMQALIPETRGLARFAVYAVLVMLPATIFIGATFPLAVRMLAENERHVAAATGRVYAWNTVGAIVGAVTAGFYLIPWLGFAGTIKLAASVNLLLALAAAVLLMRRRPVPIGAAAALLLVVLAFYAPARPQAVIATTAFDVPAAREKELFFTVGRSATVRLTESDGSLELRTNGLPEASVQVRGAPPVGQVSQWMHALPIAARPTASTMMVVGFGGGVALEGVPGNIEEIDVVELEPEVIEANGRMAGLRAVDPLDDPRVHVIVNDARNALRLTSKRYDIIVSQPSHPWTAGASHLFTQEFVELAKSHLAGRGVFLQWISGGFVDEELLRSLTATLLAAFDNVRLYNASGRTLFFIASDSPLDIERELARTGQPLTSNLLHYSYLGLNGVDDFVAALMLDERAAVEFSAGAEPSTDDRNLMATHSRTLADGLTPDQLIDVLAPYDPLLDVRSAVRTALGGRLNYPYIASRLLSRGQTSRARRLASTIEDASTRHLVTSLVRGATGQLDGAREALRQALRANPRNDAARFALIEARLPALATGRADADVRGLAGGLTGSADAVVRGWALAVTGDMEGLAKLDRELARTNVTDLWFPHATQLRADWRTRVAGETRFAFDAIRMLDRAIFLRPNIDLFVLRASAADVLGDAHAFTETTRYAVRYLNEYLDRAERIRVPPSDEELAVTVRRLDAWQLRLGQLRGQADGRVDEVFDQLGALLHRYESLARDRGLVGG